MARSNTSLKEIAEDIRDKEKNIIFGLCYDKLLPKNMEIMKQLSNEFNQCNEKMKNDIFEELAHLHSSDLWMRSINFIKEYLNDKRMTIGTLRSFIEKNRSEIAQPKKINILDYFEKPTAPTDQNNQKYIQVGRNLIKFSYFKYLVSEAQKFKLEAIYLLSNEISIDEKYFMKRILSRKFYIFDSIDFEQTSKFLLDEINYNCSWRVPYSHYKPGIGEFDFCQEIISQYSLDILMIFPSISSKYKKNLLDMFSKSAYKIQLSNYEHPFNFSNYRFYNCCMETFNLAYNKKFSACSCNQNFETVFALKSTGFYWSNIGMFIFPFVASYECVKRPEKMREETRKFILEKLNENCFKSDLLSDVLMGNDRKGNDSEYSICVQILNNQDYQLETFSNFYKIIGMNNNMYDPYELENAKILLSFDFSKYENVANCYKSLQSRVYSKVINQLDYLTYIIKEKIEKKGINFEIIKYFIENEFIILDDISSSVLKMLMNVSEQEEVKEYIQIGKVEINPVESDLDISWILDLVKYSEKVKFIYSLRTYDFVNIYKSLQKEDKREIEMIKEFLKTGNSKVLDSYENEISEEFFDTFVSHPEFFNTNNLIKSINNLSLPFKTLNENSICVLNQLIEEYRSDLEISFPYSNFFYFFKHCEEIFPFVKEIDGFWNYKPPKYQSFSGFIKDINKMVHKKKIPTDLPKLQAFCNSFESQEEELYIDDIKYIKTEGKYQMKTLMNLEISQNVTDVSDKFISDLNEEKLTVGSLILRLLQNSNAFECNMKIFSNYFKERNEEQKLKIEKQSNLSEFYFNLQKEIESKEKIHKTKISFINDFNDDLPEKMTKERFYLFEKLLFVDKNKWKLIENSFLAVFTFCEENHLFRYQEHIIAYTLKCIEENNNIFFTNPLKELYKFILNQVSNEKQNEFSDIYKFNKENEDKISLIQSNMKSEVINAAKSDFASSKSSEIKEKFKIYSSYFPKIVKNVPLLMVKPKFESVDYSFDKVKFYNMILSYNQLNLDLSEYKEFVEYDFVFQDKGPLYVKNIKTDKSYCYSQSQSPHLLTLGNSSKSNYKFENSNPAWTTVRIPKIRQNFEDYNFEFFCNLYQELEDLVRKENIESQTIFGLNFNDFTEFLGTISKIKKENFSFNFQNHMNSIKLDSTYPNTFGIIKKFIDISKEIKDNDTNKDLEKLVLEKLSKIKEIEIPNINYYNNRNIFFNLQTKFTPKIIVTSDGIKPNFSQIYFCNHNVNFEILEIYILIEGSFQFLDVFVESSANIKSEVVEDKIILTVDLSSKQNKIEGILKILDLHIPICLNFKFNKWNSSINGPNFVFNKIQSDLDFRTADIEPINTNKMARIVELIESYKNMSDKFSALFFSYLKSYQPHFPINLLRTFSIMYSLHEFFESSLIDNFCPFYSSSEEFETSFCHLLRNLGIDTSSEEKDFEFYNIFCYKSPSGLVVDDPNIKRKITIINEIGAKETETLQQDIAEQKDEHYTDKIVIEKERSNQMNITSERKSSKVEAITEEVITEITNPYQENVSQTYFSEESFVQENQANYLPEEKIKTTNQIEIETKVEEKQYQNERVFNQISQNQDQMKSQDFNNIQNYLNAHMQMQNFQERMQHQIQSQIPPQFQRMIPPHIQNNPQAIIQYQQIQQQYRSLQIQLSYIQQSAFQFYQQFGINPINEILMSNGSFFYPPYIENEPQQQTSQHFTMLNDTSQQKPKL
ncbi:hypothetical protein TVAG_139100 [Trichomonas vaginalis G3]|uniref:Uncharacterized protein n=1 Tax=Trichomonas vaginalis (strain ATCC PRA-98 / G3) TaxID=412133 RepID=A2E484_TRIV3|nr:zebrafish dkey-56m19.5 family [Trichomonas vaginalis G3]EAY12530.1 hypothetical protein TVAG_139100 [Trichomonas vaginalis G3]KAI5554068.1 zebrafish dkey-56m19.5 family [Trichomonas vaginalis G3]|eukprot:XP_001324753.1 hypothetical protein [Trichomonas vaginalis G3]